MNRHPRLKIACPTCGQKLDVTGHEPFQEVVCPTCDSAIIVPKLFGDFLLEERIGRGGMAIVYRALDLTLHRDVALKVLNEQVMEEPGAAEQFLQEGRAAAAISHVNVVPIYSSGWAEGRPYLVMQYMEGLSLDRQMEGAPAPLVLDFCLRVAAEATRGLAAAFAEGIVHHDIKPANILLDADGIAKVGDFGLAQLLSGGRCASAVSAQWATPYYVSPEKVRSGEEDYRGDVYSLGATLYHLIARKPPFRGGSNQAIMDARVATDPVSLRVLRPEVPVAAAEVIDAMLHREPENRLADYRAIAECFESSRRTIKSGAAVAAADLSPSSQLPRRLTTGKFPRLIVGDGVAGTGCAWLGWTSVPQMVAALLERGRRGYKFLLIGVLGILAVCAVVWWSLPSSGDSSPLPVGHSRTEVLRSRPRPGNLDFHVLRSEVDTYLDRLPPADRRVEQARLRLLIGIRFHLADALRRISYRIPENGLRLRTGDRLVGTLVAVRSGGFTLVPAGSDAPVRVGWNQLAWSQIAEFFDAVMQSLLDNPGADLSFTAAEEALRAAVFCDWFDCGRPASAYVRKALKLNPAMRSEVRRVFPSYSSEHRPDSASPE